MQSGLSLFKTKVAKRIFFLFLLCAMLPIAVFSLVSFTQVSAQLRDQALTRLQNSAKSHGLGILERFSFLEANLDLFLSTFPPSLLETGEFLPDNGYTETIKGHFKALAYLPGRDNIVPLFGDINPLPSVLTDSIQGGITSKTASFFIQNGLEAARIFLVKTVPGVDGTPCLLAGEVNPVYLWGIGYENSLPAMTDVCILDHTRNVLFSSFQMPESVLHQIRFESADLETRSQEYTSDGEGYFIGYWPMFLKSKFEGPNLIVVLRNNREDIFAPLSYFKILFPLVAILAFWIVLLLSTISIRKSMGPLEKLKEGALRLARRDFDSRVAVTTGDEFETLADTFNSSAAHLGRQFRAMESMSKLDRAVLSSFSMKDIFDTALKGAHAYFSCDAVSFGLVQERQPNTIHSISYYPGKSEKILEEFFTIAPEDREALSNLSDALTLEVKDQVPSYLPQNLIQDIKYFIALPLILNNTFAGIIYFGNKESQTYTKDELTYAKRFSNQVSVALSNAHLVEELELLNWGTLEALARTVDAKSKWTAGHSERVSEMAVRIARVMGCDQKAINTIHRAGFLHDIGKIGVPLLILDKPGKLTDAEYDQVKEHPVIGAKILEPIEVYQDAIPMILQHHERFDGKGYPYGIFGEELSLGARILSVADVYDALISSRPYRQGWVEEKVIQLIVDESGKQFDPKVVDAFQSAVSWSIDDILNKGKLSSL